MAGFLGDEPLALILAYLSAARSRQAAGSLIEMVVPDPDLGAGLFSGELGPGGGRHRSYRTWLDLADRLELRFLTPVMLGEGRVRLRFQILDAEADWHEDKVTDPREKYGTASRFARIDKLEEPCFLGDFLEALQRVALRPGARVLDLGCNDGQLFRAFSLVHGPELLASMQFTGVDHCESAIERARAAFPQGRFHCHDLSELWSLGLKPQDLVFSVGTLQSPGIQAKDLIMQTRKRLLKNGGALILGFPNVRYLDGELRQGARTRNYSESELSLLVKDLFFFRRYFQQQQFRVTLTGKYYLFLTAWQNPAR